MKRVTYLILLSALNLSAQNVPVKSMLQVTGFIDKGKILLRWAPENSVSWLRGNKHGYSVFRKVVMRDGKVIRNADSTLIGIYHPLPLEKWNPYADSNYYAVAAEAIYGQEFEVTAQSKTFFDLVNKSKEQENRFSMGLLCADQSFAVACMMGLGLIDSTAKNNEAYLYKVVMNSSETFVTSESGFAIVDFIYGNFTPRPFGFSPQVKENTVTILLPYQPFKGIYNNFEIQRSDDGSNFHSINSSLFYSMSTVSDDPQYNIYIDSVASQAKTLFYRLRGRTPFGIYGPFSDTLSVKIMPSLTGEPWITNIKEIGNDKLIISWETPTYKRENLKGFKVSSSKKYSGQYQDCTNLLDYADEKSTIVDMPEGYAYFRIAAVDQFDRSYLSIPKLYQAIDSIPPSIPEGLTGEFDTSGVVNLKWNYGREKDLLGYQVLYSANAGSEYALIEKDFIFDSTYRAAFPTSMLSSYLYFKIAALDTRFNTSKTSHPIRLIKPDKLPPSPPFISISKDSAGISSVSVAPSHSFDVTLHHLYFSPLGSAVDKIEIFNGCLKNDTTITLNTISASGDLICVAEDITGRKGYSNKIFMQQTTENPKESFRAVAIPKIDDGVVELLWDKNLPDGSLMIYRKDDTNGYRLISTVDSSRGLFKDQNVTVNINYTYKLVSFPLKGKSSANVVSVKYK